MTLCRRLGVLFMKLSKAGIRYDKATKFGGNWRKAIFSTTHAFRRFLRFHLASPSGTVQRMGQTTSLWRSEEAQLFEIERITEQNEDLNQKYWGYTMLHYAAILGNVRVLLRLLEVNVDVDFPCKSGRTALHFATQHNHPEVVKLLINAKANVGIRDHAGETVLHCAATYCSETAMKLLLSVTEDIDVTNIYGNTPLHIASLHGHFEIVRILLDTGANVHSRNRHLQTPLHIAAKVGAVAILKILLDGGADIQSRTFAGYTALHKAAYTGSASATKFLLERGSNFEARNRHGMTALQIAEKLQHLTVINAIKEHERNMKKVWLQKHHPPLIQECFICCETLHRCNFFDTSHWASHNICKSCITRHLQVAIVEQQNTNLMCPSGCGFILGYEDVKAVNVVIFVKYESSSANANIDTMNYFSSKQ